MVSTIGWLLALMPMAAALALVLWMWWSRRAGLRPPPSWPPTAPQPPDAAEPDTRAGTTAVQPLAGGGGGPTRPTLPR